MCDVSCTQHRLAAEEQLMSLELFIVQGLIILYIFYRKSYTKYNKLQVQQ